MLEAVEADPHVFESYGAANTGMQAQELMTDDTLAEFKRDWAMLSRISTTFARDWSKRAAKQMVNRTLEPFMHVTAVISGTEWRNFFRLRAHRDAQPEFQVLAYNMLHHYLQSQPNSVARGKWHTPLLSYTENSEWDTQTRIITSVARCARISYAKHEVVKSIDDDIELFKKLEQSGHMSPFEHAAMACERAEAHGNFLGWVQWRKFLTNESGREGKPGDLAAIYASKPTHIKIYE